MQINIKIINRHYVMVDIHFYFVDNIKLNFLHVGVKRLKLIRI